jgi:hypothetical protein
MEPTVLVYASHDRCNLIHNDWLVQRALRGNRRLLFLPLSTPTEEADETRHQRAAWESFHCFFRYYAGYGLDSFPFFWHSGLRRQDVDLLWHALAGAEVVILGGGYPQLGMERFEQLGGRFYDDPDRFGRVLRERQARGLLTAGFSAGADQLCALMSSASGPAGATAGLGLARTLIATSHFEPGQEPWLAELAWCFPHCMVFGLPNDSALAVAEGRTRAGTLWQSIEVVVDTSWDRPEDGFHIRTRQGVLVQHRHADGRHWGLGGGDRMLRLCADDGSTREAFLFSGGRPGRDYRTGQPSAWRSIDDLLAAR